MQFKEELTQWISVGRIGSIPAMDLECCRVVRGIVSPNELQGIFVVEDHMVLIVVISWKIKAVLS